MIDAVLFDLFGTLVPNLDPAAHRAAMIAIAAELDAELSAFETLYAATFRDRMIGRFRDDDEHFAPLMAQLGLRPRAGALQRAARLRNEMIRSGLRPKPDAVACLRAVRAAGLKTALVTDCSSITPGLFRATELGEFFEVIAASAELGCTKPDERMYRHALAGIHAAPERCIYVGDGNSEELVGARRLGMRTVWVDNGAAQHFKERFVPEADERVTELAALPGLIQALATGAGRADGHACT